MTTSTRATEPQQFFIEARPGGGWAVKLLGHPAPVSLHDTEEEADAKAAACRRGTERAAAAPSAPDAGVPPAVGDTRLICARCGDVIGSYEPLIVVIDGEPRLTSKTAEPGVAQRGELFHGDCFALTVNRPEARAH